MISVIVPAFNVKKYICSTLLSVLEQTYENIEIVVVDDGSTDGTFEVLKAFAMEYPEKVRVIHTPNSGVTNARLIGVRHAQGEWIGFVDGDDEVEPDMYQRLLENARQYGADISHCGYRMMFEDGRTSYFYNSGCLRQQDHIAGLADLLDGTLIEPSLCNKLFRRELFEPLLNQGAMLENVKINEDLLMNFILFKGSHKSVFEDVCLYHYLVRQGSATRCELTKNRIYDPIRVKARILELVPSSVQRHAQAAYLRTCISVYNSIVLSDWVKWKKDRKLIRQYIVSHYSWTATLSKKQHLLAALIRYTPWCYRVVYGFYAVYLLKSPYA